MKERKTFGQSITKFFRSTITNQWLKWGLGSFLFGLIFPVIAIVIHMNVHDSNIHSRLFEESLIKRVFTTVLEYIDPNFHTVSFFDRMLVVSAPLVLLLLGLIIGGLYIRTKKLLSSMQESRNEIAQYTTQLENITENIQEGICVINSDYQIEANNYKGFFEIFNKRDVVSNSIFDEIFLYLNEEDKIGLQRFFTLCFTRTNISQETLDKACPVTKIRYNSLDVKSNKVQEKIISLRVLPVRSETNAVVQLLLLFKDITYQELLLQEQQLMATTDFEVEFLQLMVKMDLPKLTNYWNNFTFITNKIYEEVNHLSEEESDRIIARLQNVAGSIHSLKGEANATNLVSLVAHCSKIEPQIKAVIESIASYGFDEQLQLINWVSELHMFENSMQTILEKFGLGEEGSQQTKESTNIEDTKVISAYKRIENLIKSDYLPHETKTALQSIGELLQSSMMLDLFDFEQQLELMLNTIMAEQSINNVGLSFNSTINFIPKEVHNSVHEIFIHLIRNFFSHSYETVEERLLKNKYKKAMLSIVFTEDDSNYLIRYKEDGKGFDINAIAQKALNAQLVSEEWVINASENDIIALTFASAFSTSKDITDSSGVGQGLYVVKQNVSSLNGAIKIQNTLGMGYLMIISIPKLS